MRSERELLDIVYRRAAALRRVRRARATLALTSLAAVALVAGVIAAGALGSDDDVLVAGPDQGDGTPGSRPAGGSPEHVVGRLEIPVIDVEVELVEGVSSADLRRGPGLYPESPRPGHDGNISIAGHRTTYGAPFLRIDELEPGDQIIITTSEGVFTYEVRETLIVEPTAVEVVGPTFWSDRWAREPTDTLTLTTEHPRFSSAERMVLGAELIGEPARSDRQGGDGGAATELAPDGG